MDASNVIMVPTTALNMIAYQIGNILVEGPPRGATCNSTGFIGFLGADGKIQYAIADDANYFGYTYGSEILSLKAEEGEDCIKKTEGFGKIGFTICKVPIKYSLGKNSFVLNPGESKALNGSLFSGVALLESTDTVLPEHVWVSDFAPHQMLHVLSFGNSVLNP